MRIAGLVVLAIVHNVSIAAAQRCESLSADVRQFARVTTPRVVLEHVEIIDGSGAPPQRDRNLTIENGVIAGISAGCRGHV